MNDDFVHISIEDVMTKGGAVIDRGRLDTRTQRVQDSVMTEAAATNPPS